MSITTLITILSTVSAMCSAGAAMTLLFIHFQNRKDSVAPEIILDKWDFKRDAGLGGEIQIKKIINEGKGSARNIFGDLKVPCAITG